MAKLNIVIGDYDLSYLEALSSFLDANYYEKAVNTIFSETQFLEKHLKGKKVDILLLNPDFYNKDIIARYNVKSVIFLTDDPYIEGLDHPGVNKYQQGEDLFEQVMQQHALQNPNSMENITRKYESTSVITFYSPIGGIGKTSLAVTTAMTLGRQGYGVLYLNLEDLQSTPMFFECSRDKSFSDILYLVKEKSPKIEDKFMEMKCRDDENNVDYFSPADSAMDIEELNSEDIKFLIESILKLNLYGYVIIDLASKYNNQYKSILEVSKCIVMPIGQDAIAALKCDQFLKHIFNKSKYYVLLNKYKASDGMQIQEVLDKNNIAFAQAINYDYSLSAVRDKEEILNSGTLNRAVEELVHNLGLIG